MTAAAGGDFVDVLKVAALAELNILAWGEVGNLTGGLSGGEWLGSFEGFLGNATSTAVHGIVGGGLSCLEGGSFKDGFLGAAVGEACAGAINNLHSFANDQMNILERSAAAGVIGGTAAVVSGGNFITGASTAAFERLYNEEAHSIEKKIHDSAANLAKEKIPYSEMKCNESVWETFDDAGLKVNELDNTRTFPSGINEKHFNELSADEVNKGLRTGDVGVWYGENPNTGKLVHHMIIYDANAGGGKGFDSWSTHSTNDGFFGPSRSRAFTKQFGFEPTWYRYSK